MDKDRDSDGVYTGAGTKTIQLRTPIKRDGAEDIVAVTLQEPTAKQLSVFAEKKNATNDDAITATIGLVSMVSGLMPPDVEKMKSRDLDACATWLALFTAAPKPNPGDSATA